MDGLKKYREKRNFRKTHEPAGRVSDSSSGHLFVIQKHAARRLHYDLRLEAEGVLKSWAVPKGPSFDPAEKRMAVHVEDHPLDYGDFEGTIEPGQYGAGTVMVWDRGTWRPEGDWKKGLEKGHLKFELKGAKMKGKWSLVRLRGGRDNEGEAWLLIKSADRYVRGRETYDITEDEPFSVKTGRNLEEIRTGKSPGEDYRQSEIARVDTDGLVREKGRKAPMPDTFSPQLATLVSRVPSGGLWVNEIKYDGYRLIARVRNGQVQLMTRGSQDWTDKFASIAGELSGLSADSAMLDGEIVVQNPDGATDFQKLQDIPKGRSRKNLIYYVFDLVYLDGYDLTGFPLAERKTILEELLRNNQDRMPSVRYSRHIEGRGAAIFQAACRHGAEGIVSKRADLPYVQRRSQGWVKIKCTRRQEFIVGGYTDPKGSRQYFGSLLLGYYENGALKYCGNVGTGFNAKTMRETYERLKKCGSPSSYFDSPVDRQLRQVHWTSPKLVVEVEYSGMTDEGRLRHPSFNGIREDKEPGEVILERESPLPAAQDASVGSPEKEERHWKPSVRLTHPDKVLYPEQGLTKKELARYYLDVADWMLPEIAGRPLTIVRCPEGVDGGCFFQKHLGNEAPKWIRTIPIREKDKVELYPVVEDVKGLLSLVQLGALEIHAWGSRMDHLEQPDRMIFDLDPSPEITRERLIEAARYAGSYLKENKLATYLKTTGGKGLHLVIPLRPSLDWDEVKKISKAIAEDLVRRRPDLFVSVIAKSRRTGKILVDYLRNGRGATSIMPYSTRARPGAPVAVPISEDELTADLLSVPFTIEKVRERLHVRKKDPWEDLY